MKSVFFVIALLFAALLNSCAGLRGKEDARDFKMTVYSTGWYMGEVLSSKYITYSKKEVVPLLPEKKENGPVLEFFMDTLDILDQTDGKLLRQNLYGGEACQEYVENVYSRVTGEYQNTKIGASDLSGAAYNWSYSETFDGAVYPSLLVISRHIYNYTGGANGQNEKIFFVLDTKLSSKVELNDILAEGVEKDIQAQIDDDLRARYHAAPGAPLTSAGFLNDTAGVPQNFFISREGLGFCWNPYEIAPHSMGTLEVVLPYERVKNLLNDRGREMFENL